VYAGKTCRKRNSPYICFGFVTFSNLETGNYYVYAGKTIGSFFYDSGCVITGNLTLASGYTINLIID
jgi:hypothetical protein